MRTKQDRAPEGVPESCANCFFWIRGLYSDGYGTWRPDVYGKCRRHPPRLVVRPQGSISSIETTFPTTNERSWCGEYAFTYDVLVEARTKT